MTDGQITRSSEMTNEQIEKALLICYGRAPLDECDCICCPYVERKHCNDELMTDVINLICRQKAEAIKEFAEKLKTKTHNYYPSIDSYCTSRHVVLAADIDDLVKEMTEVCESEHL